MPGCEYHRPYEEAGCPECAEALLAEIESAAKTAAEEAKTAECTCDTCTSAHGRWAAWDDMCGNPHL